MAFYLIGSYINSIDDSTMQQLNAMSDPAAKMIYNMYFHLGDFNRKMYGKKIRQIKKASLANSSVSYVNVKLRKTL